MMGKSEGVAKDWNMLVYPQANWNDPFINSPLKKWVFQFDNNYPLSIILMAHSSSGIYPLKMVIYIAILDAQRVWRLYVLSESTCYLYHWTMADMPVDHCFEIWSPRFVTRFPQFSQWKILSLHFTSSQQNCLWLSMSVFGTCASWITATHSKTEWNPG